MNLNLGFLKNKVEDFLIFLLLHLALSGTVEVLSYPSLRPLDTLMAHTAGCYCIAIDPVGRYVSKCLSCLVSLIAFQLKS